VDKRHAVQNACDIYEGAVDSDEGDEPLVVNLLVVR
jgi:hypothetical protein